MKQQVDIFVTEISPTCIDVSSSPKEMVVFISTEFTSVSLQELEREAMRVSYSSVYSFVH